MGKIIIDNRSSSSDETAIQLVAQVMIKGRISNYGSQYCYATIFGKTETRPSIAVYTDLNKKSDRFVITDA
jgi:hypothetical protein